MRLYVIRHGETSWNVARKLQGHQGADLDENGVRLAEITARGMKDIPFELCFTSPLPRARHTAEIILAGRDVPVIEEPRIMEIGFGEWEGLCCAPGRSEIPGDGFEKFHRAPFEYTAPPGGGKHPRRMQTDERIFSGADTSSGISGYDDPDLHARMRLQSFSE